MKAIALIVVLITLAVGTYLGNRTNRVANETMVEDSVGSQMAAPQKTDDTGTENHPDIPL